jgi:peptidoglycan/xylan/chitin deacetylase (PgdA/CDA1 family)
MNRRGFLYIFGAGAAVSLSACAARQPVMPSSTPSPIPPALPSSVPKEITTVTVKSPVVEKVPLPGGGIYDLPGEGSFLAWTVDDGTSEEVICKYAQFAAESDTRLTFFINGIYDLKPLVESGQVQIANHTWSHPDLTSLSNQSIIDELNRNEQFIVDTFGVSSKPFYRPPYGSRNDRTDAAAAEIGFTAPIMWYGSLGDSGELTEQEVLTGADKWFGPQRIVIGHANFPSVTGVFPQLLEIIKNRGLVTVTLNDYFSV